MTKKEQIAWIIISRLLDTIEVGMPDFYTRSSLVTEADKTLQLLDGEMTQKEYDEEWGN